MQKPEKNYPELRQQMEDIYDQIADRYAASTAEMPARIVEQGGLL